MEIWHENAADILNEGNEAEANDRAERRRQPRVEFLNHPAILRVEGTDYPVFIRDLSLFGAFIVGALPSMAPGTEVMLRIKFEECDIVQAAGAVIHRRDMDAREGVGLRLRNLDRSAVLTLVHRLSQAAA